MSYIIHKISLKLIRFAFLSSNIYLFTIIIDSSTKDPCAGNFKCGGNKYDCLPMSRVCDRVSDCFDDSDEKWCGK